MAVQGIQFQTWKQNDKTNTLNARLFNGAVSFTVFPRERQPGAPSKPLIKINFDQAGVGIQNFFKIADAVKKGTLGTKMPLARTQYDMQTRTRKNVWVITLEKDQEMCYRLTLTDCVTNASFSFIISNSASFQTGNEPVSKAELSAQGLENLLDWMRLAKMYAPMTSEPFKPGQRPGAGGGVQRPAAPSNGGMADTSGDDMPF